MDCGHAFSEKYGNAANNQEALNRIIDDVEDTIVPLTVNQYDRKRGINIDISNTRIAGTFSFLWNISGKNVHAEKKRDTDRPYCER